MFLFAAGVLLLAASPEDPLDFDTDVLPVLTKTGCNAAACHGAASGRGGFKLSLFGGSPMADYDEIVHRLKGRRIDWRTPSESLFILKPAGYVDHGGGVRFDADGPEARLLANWVARGAPRLGRTLQQLAVTPDQLVLESVPSEVRIAVNAKLSDDTTRDVTNEAIFYSTDPSAVEVEGDQLKVLRRGRHIIVVRYLSSVQTVQITVPLNDQEIKIDAAVRQNWIDDEVLATLADLRLPLSPQSDDAAMLRRITLDLTGRLPQVDTVRQYIANQQDGKFATLIDQLIDSPQFVDYWTFKFARLFRLRAQPKEKQPGKAFYAWIHRSLADNSGMDAMIGQMVTAVGDTHEVGPANFYRVASDARSQAEFFSEVLMGTRLRCANCHNHPLDHWTQDDYHGLAAIFSRLQRGRVIRALSRGEVTHPGTGKAAVAKLPGDRFLEELPDQRRPLADWIVDKQNPYFARAMVNRIWKALMGRGLVEPTDDLRATNPASHPVLLRRLSEEFAASGFDVRHIIRTITMSAAYQRSGLTLPSNSADDRFYSHAIARPLESEVLADAIADVTGVAETYGTEPLGTRAIELVDPQTPSTTLDALGRCVREGSCEDMPVANTGTLTTRLHLLNGPLLNRKLQSAEGRLKQAIVRGGSVHSIVEEFTIHALGRPPTSRERQYWSRELATADDDKDRADRLEDFVWSLLNCQQFVTNH